VSADAAIVHYKTPAVGDVVERPARSCPPHLVRPVLSRACGLGSLLEKALADIERHRNLTD
jgi:hypothetical protein